MAKYEKEFSHLSKYAPKLVLTETFRCKQLEDGLKGSIKRYPHCCYIVASSKFLSAGSSGNENREIGNEESGKKSRACSNPTKIAQIY